MKNKMVVSIVWLLALPVLTPGTESESIHAPWSSLLQAHVKKGNVDYSGLKADKEHMNLLEKYLKVLGKTEIADYSRQEKLAFWINAYNAFTIKLIINHYPVKSIKDIKKPWKEKIWTAAGETLSLDDIEHKKLRKELKEPRIHFAIVCASIGCPDLDNLAFLPENMEERLNDRARYFFTQGKNFRLEVEGEETRVYVSSIIKWFSDDFGRDQSERLSFISKYLDPQTAARVKNTAGVKLKYLDYDWKLNGS
ncbi:DUF547 domain-containing protein [Fibrobacterota bacterium]